MVAVMKSAFGVFFMKVFLVLQKAMSYQWNYIHFGQLPLQLNCEIYHLDDRIFTITLLIQLWLATSHSFGNLNHAGPKQCWVFQPVKQIRRLASQYVSLLLLGSHSQSIYTLCRLRNEMALPFDQPNGFNFILSSPFDPHSILLNNFTKKWAACEWSN